MFRKHNVLRKKKKNAEKHKILKKERKWGKIKNAEMNGKRYKMAKTTKSKKKTKQTKKDICKSLQRRNEWEKNRKGQKC